MKDNHRNGRTYHNHTLPLFFLATTETAQRGDLTQIQHSVSLLLQWFDDIVITACFCKRFKWKEEMTERSWQKEKEKQQCHNQPDAQVSCRRVGLSRASLCEAASCDFCRLIDIVFAQPQFVLAPSPVQTDGSCPRGDAGEILQTGSVNYLNRALKL